MLGGHGDDVLALGPGVEMRRALDGEVVRLGGTGGPDDFLGIGADQGGDFLARFLHGLLGFPSIDVGARGRIAEVLGQPGNHFCGHTRVDRGGCRVVEVHRQFH